MNNKAIQLIIGCLMRWGATRTEAVQELSTIIKTTPDIKDVYLRFDMVNYDHSFFNGEGEYILKKV